MTDDSGQPAKLDWKRAEFLPGTIIYDLLLETLAFCKHALRTNEFQRGEHQAGYS